MGASQEPAAQFGTSERVENVIASFSDEEVSLNVQMEKHIKMI